MRPRKHNLDLPKRVYMKHGTYYYVTAKSRWISLGKTREEMWNNLSDIRVGPKTRIESEESERLNAHLRIVYAACKTRAKRLGVEFEISFDDVMHMLQKSGWKCAITGHGFSFDRHGNTLKRPFIPSIDRIDSSRGYTRRNCRIVCSIANIAMNAWGDAPLLALIRSGADRYIEQKLARALDTSNSDAE